LSLDKLTAKIEKILEQFDIKRILMEGIALVKKILSIKMKNKIVQGKLYENEIIIHCDVEFEPIVDGMWWR
jgi:hypothetical protein